jgi:hypothetical protein
MPRRFKREQGDGRHGAKGHRYMTPACNLQGATVEYIGDECREANLSAYFAPCEPETRAALRAISMDAWPISLRHAQGRELEDGSCLGAQDVAARTLGMPPWEPGPGKVFLTLRERPGRLVASRLYAHLFRGT